MRSIPWRLLAMLGLLVVATRASATPMPCVRQEVTAPEYRRDALTGRPLYAAARAALVRESRATGLATAAETHELLDLFCAAMRDTQLTEADRLSTRNALRGRLLAIERGLKSQVKVATKAAIRAERLANRGARGGKGSTVASASKESGGVSGAAGGAAIADNARQLIELIQRTISPDSWDVNGGNGTIVYFAPLQALVVRTTAEVHEGVGRAVGAARP